MDRAESIINKIKPVFKNKYFIYILLFLFCIFLANSCREYDFDLYARLIVGENFFEKGVFNYNDYMSYTPTHKWFDHEYGASLIFYLFFKYLGPAGLVVIQGLLIFLTCVFIILTQKIQKHAYPTSVFITGLFLILFSHQHPSLVRCHMFSFVFFAMFLYFLEKTRIGYLENKPSKILWLVPPLVIIWNNIHGGIFSGLGIIFIYMIGALISRQNWFQYLKVLVISTPLLAINPYGFEYIKFLFFANTKSRTLVTEWQSIFTRRHIIYYYPLFAVNAFGIWLVLTGFVNRKKICITKFLVILVTFLIGAMHVKLLPLPLIVFFALYYNEIIQLFNKKVLRILEYISFIAIISAIFCIPLNNPNIPKTNISKFPQKEIEFIKINNIKGNIVTEFEFGSYVAYKLYPDNLIYMDGRYEEVYNDTEFQNLMNFEHYVNNWNAVLEEYPTDILLMDKRIPVYPTLENLQGWAKIYEGDICGVFVKKPRLKKHYKLPENNIEYYKKNEFVNKGFFGKIK